MAYEGTSYGHITPRTAAYVSKELLKRGMPFLVFERFGQAKPIPKNSTQSIKFRRYFLESADIFALDTTTPSVTDGVASGPGLVTEQDDGTIDYTPFEYFDGTNNPFRVNTKVLAEGTTPSSSKLASEDISKSLVQYGDWVQLTDMIADTHEDPVLQEIISVLGEQAALVIERTRYNDLVLGTNAFYSGGTSTVTVDSIYDLNLQRRAVRRLKKNLARQITSVVKSTTSYGTQPIAPSFICVVHPDMESDLRSLGNFVPAEAYGSTTPLEGELGKCEEVRFIVSTIVQPLADEGKDAPTGVLLNGTAAMVYPALLFAKDAYALISLKGKHAITPMVRNPNNPSSSDPLGQRGFVSWKTTTGGALILNPAWMVRLECAVSDLLAAE